MSLIKLSAKLDRTDSGTPWGFRLHGGQDFGAPLSIQRITPGSLAAKCGVQVGDVITRIGGIPIDGLRHKDAQQRILDAGNSLELTLERGGHMSYHVDSPSYAPSPPQPAYGGSPYGGQAYNPSPRQFDTYNNSVNSITSQTASLTFGSPHPDVSSPPWGSSPAPQTSYRPSPAAVAACVSPRGGSGNVWQPQIPTGPRKMRVAKPGDAKTLAATASRIPICHSCNNTIRGPFVSALDKTWCPDHFICANPQCCAPLINIGFVEEEGQLFCERDYEQYFAPRCGKCTRAIIGEVVNALKNTYHMNCFLCSQCHQPIGSNQFHNEDGKILCQKDWAAMFQTQCYGCSFPIEPGDRWVEALSQNWHSECFNCATCQVNLEGQSFFAKAGKPYCKKHATTSRF